MKANAPSKRSSQIVAHGEKVKIRKPKMIGEERSMKWRRAKSEDRGAKGEGQTYCNEMKQPASKRKVDGWCQANSNSRESFRHEFSLISTVDDVWCRTSMMLPSELDRSARNQADKNLLISKTPE